MLVTENSNRRRKGDVIADIGFCRFLWWEKFSLTDIIDDAAFFQQGFYICIAGGIREKTFLGRSCVCFCLLFVLFLLFVYLFLFAFYSFFFLFFFPFFILFVKNFVCFCKFFVFCFCFDSFSFLFLWFV